MNLKKKIAILAILGVTGLYATGVKDINVLVDQINSTTDQKVKSQLLDKLETQLESMDKKDLAEAQEVVNTKLKKPNTMKN
ncbi:MAG: restriction endonuclease [Arcobacter sp.]|nr:MAG: restriction endonuclease [Arcobacter sp.]